MKQRSFTTAVAVCATCAVVGAAVSGIATSSAATQTPTTSSTAAAATAPDGPGFGGRPGGGPDGGGRHGGGPGGGDGIHSEQVRADPDGTGFVTVASDTGTLAKVSGTTLTLKEGTATETFDTVEVVADGTVKVRRNGVESKLADLKVGDHLRVSKDGTTTCIDATTAAFEKERQAEHAAREQERGADASWPRA